MPFTNEESFSILLIMKMQKLKRFSSSQTPVSGAVHMDAHYALLKVSVPEILSNHMLCWCHWHWIVGVQEHIPKCLHQKNAWENNPFEDIFTPLTVSRKRFTTLKTVFLVGWLSFRNLIFFKFWCFNLMFF